METKRNVEIKYVVPLARADGRQCQATSEKKAKKKMSYANTARTHERRARDPMSMFVGEQNSS